MTTLADMQALVVGQTRRPEVPEITDAAIRSATLRAHHVDFFPRDLAQHTLSYAIANSPFYDFTGVSAQLARLRSIKTVTSVDAQGQPVEQFEFREASDLFDADGYRRPHVYTLLGDTLRVFPVMQTGALGVHFYQNPVLTGFQYSSWIATTYPDELAMWAASIVFARTGFLEMANTFQNQHVIPFREMLIASHLLGGA